eukprot:s2843_g1.t1
MLLVTKRSSESSASSIDNIAIRAFIEAKAAHFRRAVYILTEITPGASDGSDIVLGVNLCRTLETPNMEGLHCDVTGDLLQQLQREGVDVLWMNGGPVKPRHVCAMTLLHHTVAPSTGPATTLIAGMDDETPRLRQVVWPEWHFLTRDVFGPWPNLTSENLASLHEDSVDGDEAPPWLVLQRRRREAIIAEIKLLYADARSLAQAEIEP